MKKIGIIVAAMALVLGLSQCKKEQPTTTNGNDVVAITLDIQNNRSTRMDVNTGTGEVTYETGDVIYVASGGTFIGTLTHNGTNFAGTITNPTVGEPLDFYFLGNVTPAETLTAGTTESCSVVIGDQTEHLPVIEYAPSDENYSAGATAFTAFLLNKCALVKFNVTTSSEAATCVTGFNNKVTVDFTDASFTYSQTNGGNITLPSGSGERWAILLPQEAMEAGEAGSAYSVDGAYTGTCDAVPAIYDNGFLTAGIVVNVTTEVNPGEIPVGAINGKFTINADGDQVYFSQGNLQYQASTNTWRFAEHQWDYVGGYDVNYLIDYGNVYDNGLKCDNSLISSSYNGWVDLFGWGTSGWNNGNIYYQPYDTESFWDSESGYGYGPTDGTNYGYDLAGTYANADWGVYNAISNGGNTPNQWRTLTEPEWGYVFNNRNTPSGIRYAKGIVNDVKGVILLPDDWNSSVYTLNYTNRPIAPYSTNEITLANWETMETNGAVFLPASGWRSGTSYYNSYGWGKYWSVTNYYNNEAYIVNFYDSSLSYTNYDRRPYGFSLRMARDVE